MTAKVTRRKSLPKSKKIAVSTHVKASLRYVAPHKHTGKRLAHKQTSHGVLLIILILAGIILLLNLATLRASGLSGNVDVSLTVPAPPPTTGVHITSPTDGSRVTTSLVTVSGTCPTGNLVAIYRNGVSAGSTICTDQSTFSLPVQLQPGLNVLQAQNYDALNQPGPSTSQISVTYIAPLSNNAATPAADQLPSPVPQPSASPCYLNNQQVPQGHALILLVPCITRSVYVGENLSLPVTITGGIKPYALYVDWGDTTTTELFSFASDGRQFLAHTFATSGIKTIQLRLADSTGNSYRIQTVVQVDGTTAVPASSPLQGVGNTLQQVWVEASVPVYWSVVALFAGFWIGDIFQRVVAVKTVLKKRPARRRHA